MMAGKQLNFEHPTSNTELRIEEPISRERTQRAQTGRLFVANPERSSAWVVPQLVKIREIRVKYPAEKPRKIAYVRLFALIRTQVNTSRRIYGEVVGIRRLKALTGAEEGDRRRSEADRKDAKRRVKSPMFA